MKTGVQVGIPGVALPDPNLLPAQMARFEAHEPPPFIWTMPPWIEELKQAGKDGIARCFYDAPWWDMPIKQWLLLWAKNIDVDLHEFGNEPHPDVWPQYRRILLDASPVLRAAGRRVILTAVQTGHTAEFLKSTPDKVFEAVDGVAIHPYERTPLDVLAHLRMARRLVPKHLPL